MSHGPEGIFSVARIEAVVHVTKCHQRNVIALLSRPIESRPQVWIAMIYSSQLLFEGSDFDLNLMDWNLMNFAKMMTSLKSWGAV